MLTTATEVVRFASGVVRRLDAGLAQSAVRNAEASMVAAHQRWLEEMRTLGDLYALPGLTGTPDAVPPALPREQERALTVAATG